MESMKVSIVTAILNSHEIARRQLLHYNKLDLPGNVEVIFVDDGSEPPLRHTLDPLDKKMKFILCETNDKRPWTQPAARNYGARRANGDYLICTDIDHIISREVVDIAANAKAHVIRFKRYAGILDEEGNFTQDVGELLKYGLKLRYFNRGLKLPPHGNSYIFKRQLYHDLGGVDERYVGSGKYPNREEVPLKQKLKKLRKNGSIDIIDDDSKPTIYMIPNGKYCGNGDINYNPFGLFHNLSRERNIGRQTNKQKRLLRLAKRAINNNPSAK
jgi:glycosyltransferase involved in cell wall biosynthesis